VALVGYIVVVYGFLADTFIYDKVIATTEMLGALTIFTVTVLVSAYKVYFAHANK
jgi:hypothetical protein